MQKKSRKAKDEAAFERRVTLIKEMRLRQQINLLKKRTDEVITLKETQIAEKDSLVNFNFENSISFLYFDSFI